MAPPPPEPAVGPDAQGATATARQAMERTQTRRRERAALASNIDPASQDPARQDPASQDPVSQDPLVAGSSSRLSKRCGRLRSGDQAGTSRILEQVMACGAPLAAADAIGAIGD